MRPISRGEIPLDDDGNNKVVADYKDWRQDLIDRIGNYCSYCNMVLNDSPQVEHVTAQDIDPAKRLEWDNMVLGCGPCNRAKSNKPCPTDTHFLPDFHNTHLAFDYIIIDHPRRRNKKACIPIPKPGLAQADKAQNTIELCKLDALTSNPRATDLRWKYRFDACVAAQKWRQSWDNSFSGASVELQREFIELLKTAVAPTGFFSIWFDAFSDIAAVKLALINCFPNTHLASFDAAFNPIARNLGDL